MSLKEKLLEEQDKLARIIGTIQPRLECAPEGTLRLSKSNSYIQYYHCTEENKIGKYISKGRGEVARQLAQKSYDEKVLRLAEKRINQIHRILKDYEDDAVYASNMVRKIQAYENNGIFVGEKLILTYETEKDILSTQKIAQLAGRYLC